MICFDWLTESKLSFCNFFPHGAHYRSIKQRAIDCLQIYGCYDDNVRMVDIYKTLNSEGKVFVTMDPNSSWMDRIQWAESAFQKFLGQGDVLGCTVRSLQKHLNEKWGPCVIDLVLNGF